MAYQAKIILDSYSGSAATHTRLTTMQITYPRFVHAERLRHRAFSCSVASSRAIPIDKMIDQVVKDPVMPVWWGKNQSGMQAREELDDVHKYADIIANTAITITHKEHAARVWFDARLDAVRTVQKLQKIGLHKQIANRILEPWMWVTEIISGTEWQNFFDLRCHVDAQPELRFIAEMMKQKLEQSQPQILGATEWHLPFVTSYDEDELRKEGYPHNHQLAEISAGRCARVSYLTHEGIREPSADIALANRLATAVPMHASPFEHVAQAMSYWQTKEPIFVNASRNYGNSWMQLRAFKEKDIDAEYGKMQDSQ